MDSLDQLTFDHSTCTRLADTDGARHWSTAAGDPLAVHHCPFRPTLEGSPASLVRLHAYYRKLAEPKAGLVEVETAMVDRNVIAIRTVLKVAQQPAGRTYLATLTLPFRDFSYVLEVRCEERGWTGVRDAHDPRSVVEDRRGQRRQRDRRAPRLGRRSVRSSVPRTAGAQPKRACRVRSRVRRSPADACTAHARATRAHAPALLTRALFAPVARICTGGSCPGMLVVTRSLTIHVLSQPSTA